MAEVLDRLEDWGVRGSLDAGHGAIALVLHLQDQLELFGPHQRVTGVPARLVVGLTRTVQLIESAQTNLLTLFFWLSLSGLILWQLVDVE